MGRTQLVAALGFVVAVCQECLLSGTVVVVDLLLVLPSPVGVEAAK